MNCDHHRDDEGGPPTTHAHAMEQIHLASRELQMYAMSFDVTGNRHMAVALSGLADRLVMAHADIADARQADLDRRLEESRAMAGGLLSAVRAGALRPAPKETP